jgi:SAM-dependent methyltransferase
MTRAAALDPAAWHDVECASYTADLELWRDLADEYRGRGVLDVGCGTGRVALDLAERGHPVLGVDPDAALIAALRMRASERELPARGEVADARTLDLGARFPLAIAPMQVAQLLGGSRGRRAMLCAVRDHVEPGGALALALADPFEAVPAGEARPPLPDVREVDGWLLSSTPVALRDEGDAVAIDRLRQAVAPDGALSEQLATIVLDSCAPGTVEDEAVAAGFEPLERRHVPPTPDYVGSAVVVLRRPREAP